MALAVASVAACSSRAHTAKAPTSATTTTRVAPRLAAGFPRELRLDPERVFAAVVDLQYGDRSDSHWYMGFGASTSGRTVQLEVDALAATRGEASRDCTAIAGPAAFFMKGATYSLEITGEIRVVSAANQGAVTFRPANFAPVSCSKPAGPLVDPIRASEPRTSDEAVDRFLGFLDKYYLGLGASDTDSWYAGYAYLGTGTAIAVNVHDRTAALGRKRCDTVRPLGDWLLGPFAKQLPLQVRGTSRSGSTAWPAVNCAS